jgi:hypothetical protein
MFKIAKRACRDAMKYAKMVRYVRPRALRLQGMLQWQTRKLRAAERSWQDSIVAAEELETRYELARTSMEIGRCMGRQADLVRAERIFADIGAITDLAEARRFLARQPIQG